VGVGESIESLDQGLGEGCVGVVVGGREAIVVAAGVGHESVGIVVLLGMCISEPGAKASCASCAEAQSA
jgi:hypothetical protein